MSIDWGPHARRNDPDTSHEAAEELRPTRDVEQVVRFYAEHDRDTGWTCSELQIDPYLAQLSERHSLTKRLSDALAKGYIEPLWGDNSIITRVAIESGRQQRALHITNKGRQWVGQPTHERTNA